MGARDASIFRCASINFARNSFQFRGVWRIRQRAARGTSRFLDKSESFVLSLSQINFNFQLHLIVGLSIGWMFGRSTSGVGGPTMSGERPGKSYLRNWLLFAVQHWHEQCRLDAWTALDGGISIRTRRAAPLCSGGLGGDCWCSDHVSGFSPYLKGSNHIAFTHHRFHSFSWLRDNLDVIKDVKELAEVTETVEDCGGVYFVPAFSGLYAPYWKQEARG